MILVESNIAGDGHSCDKLSATDKPSQRSNGIQRDGAKSNIPALTQYSRPTRQLVKPRMHLYFTCEVTRF